MTIMISASRDETLERTETFDIRITNSSDIGSNFVTQRKPAPKNHRGLISLQGWTAMTPSNPGEGTLQLFPLLKEGISYVMMRPLMKDIPGKDAKCFFFSWGN